MQGAGIALLALVLAFALLFSPACSPAKSQISFPTAEEAAEEVVQAAETDDNERLMAIFGSEAEDIMSSGDPVYDRRQREVVVLAFQQGWGLVDHGADTKELVIGDEAWPFPVPLVKEATGWRFDTEAGMEEILARRIGRNELSVIEFCMTYVQAQVEYASQGHDGKPAGIYAQRTASEPGKRNGLYWEVKPGEKPSPLGTLAAQAAAEGYEDPDSSTSLSPFHGYFFRILIAQGSEATGGAKSYIEDGEMTAGFALVAHPAEYGDSGVMTFIINQDGIVYEKDLGDDTIQIASQMNEYNPDETWRPSESPD
jgi:hypothetical protein